MALVLHLLAQALADGIHLRARIAVSVEQQNRFADFNFATDERHEVEAEGFDVRTHRAGRDRLQSKSGSVFSDLFRKNSKASPWISLVPLLVAMDTTPPARCPNCAGI